MRRVIPDRLQPLCRLSHERPRLRRVLHQLRRRRRLLRRNCGHSRRQRQPTSSHHGGLPYNVDAVVPIADRADGAAAVGVLLPRDGVEAAEHDPLLVLLLMLLSCDGEGLAREQNALRAWKSMKKSS